MAAFAQYYKRFDKTYHVLQQVESIALKGKHLPSMSPLVDSNLIAEMGLGQFVRLRVPGYPREWEIEQD